MGYWTGKSLVALIEHPPAEVLALVDLAAALKADKRAGVEQPRLTGKNVALIFEKTSTRTRCAFEVACFDQGANCSYIGPGRSQLGTKESVADTARVLGRFYDAIEYRGSLQSVVDGLVRYAGVPVYNGLTDDYHPTQMLADVLTMREHSDKPLAEVSFAYLGDARNNMGHSLLLTGALLGMDVRIAAPNALQPDQAIIERAQALAKETGAQVMVTDDAEQAVAGCDFIHTDVWVSMGEDSSVWQERTELLLPYRIDARLMQAAGKQAKFMHCLPAYHDRSTSFGEQFYEDHGLVGIEVAHEIFESEAAVVFDQAENRMHTIKALLVATLSHTN
ncbi:ornithine carbamoyltransferase [Suttonella sp. R2A3]|uniref:ornithine carbamoyltransferase n=1 Tax=Suttonella sp. R2A3 TaxID=2908648 RepID=UPI001F1AC6F9|nr:ornithine carbamoyltransferase [Suttonella sp. R2A3]UJF23727.1 ornithine carbamoyltransferase [Suttonella sp. R2A3]